MYQLWQKFKKPGSVPTELGRERDYNVDLVPKFLMANEELVKILVYTQVTRYLEFQQIEGSYVYRDGKIHKVPATEGEAFNSSLMGFFEKWRAQKFFHFMSTYDLEDPATQQGLDLRKSTMTDVYKHFGLDTGTQDFIGHALALHMNNEYASSYHFFLFSIADLSIIIVT